MALDAELLGLKSAGTYRFERDLSTISNDTTTFTNLRLVVGFSKIGPFNTPNLVNSQADFIKLYGNIDRSLEKRGSFFHRSALVALSAGPILCLNLLSLDPDKDQVQSKSFSINVTNKNSYTVTLPLIGLFNTDKFWYASDESFIDTIHSYFGSSIDGNSKDRADENERMNWSHNILHFSNIGRKPISILIKKASAFNSKGFELTLNEWYGEENVPEYLNGTSYVSDYLVEVYAIAGDFGQELETTKYDQSFDYDDDGEKEMLDLNYFEPSSKEEYEKNPYKRFSSDIVYQSYFDENGFIRKENADDKTDTKLAKFLNLPSVNLLGKYVGSLIPNFVDKFGRNIWIQKLVNDDVNTLGLICVEDIAAIESAVADQEGVINEKIDIIGNNIFENILEYHTNETNENKLEIEMLSYKYNIEDLLQSFKIKRNILDDNFDFDDSDSDCYLFKEKEFKYVRMFDTFDKDDTKSDDDITYEHPYAWLMIDEDGNISTDEKDMVWTNSSVVDSKSIVYAYDEPDSQNNSIYRHQIYDVSSDKSVIVEHTSYDENDSYYFTDKNLPKDVINSFTQEDFNNNLYKIKDNETIVKKDSSLTKGDYLVSHYYKGYDEETEQEDEVVDKFTRLTRIVKTSTIYAYTKNNKTNTWEKVPGFIKVSCSDKIWRTARKIQNNAVVQIRTIDDVCDRLHWITLKGFKMREESMPNGTNDRQNEILDMLRETPRYSSTMSNLYKALIDRDYIQWRYLVDTFGLGLEEECKNVYTQLCQGRKAALAIVNCPSQADFKKSVDPSFVNRNGGVEVEYIANGANLDKNPVFLFTLPIIENGASWGAYYYPYLRISDLSAIKSVPPAAYVSNLYIQKYTRANAWSIVAGQKRGVISGNQVVGVEATLIHDNRDWLEPVGINPIIWENGVGVEVYANKTAKQTPKSALSSIHCRECCIYIQDNVESILRRYVFEYNTAQTRLEIKTLVDEFLENVKNNSGIYEYKTIMDTTNNTQEVIDNNMGVIDIYIEPVRGLEILTQRLTVMKTGGIAAGSFE